MVISSSSLASDTRCVAAAKGNFRFDDCREEGASFSKLKKSVSGRATVVVFGGDGVAAAEGKFRFDDCREEGASFSMLKKSASRRAAAVVLGRDSDGDGGTE